MNLFSILGLGLIYRIVKSQRGKDLLLLGDHTYSMKRPDYYACSTSTNNKCKAMLRLDSSGNIVMLDGDHTHPAVKYIITDSGKFVRIRARQIKRRRKKNSEHQQLDAPSDLDKL